MLEEEYQPRRVLPAHLRKPAPVEALFDYTIRAATKNDLPEVREIYNYYVKNSTVTFDETPMSHAAWRAKFVQLTELGLPFIVAESPSGQVLGYALAAPWGTKRGYRYTVENSIYLGPAASGKGLGKALLGELVARAKTAGLREMIAVIADQGAEASLALHARYGFVEVGRMGRVGFKFDRWLGTIMLQKTLK
ncbi:MAG: N-acetyltransferase family protein [Candidatus Lumbricidophila eiseniae]|uniref:N-acetyltransferase family protein n=1 Tax=Candidatus Lumbricidiphila eiseniae TaxID=1969409 RepID=A0A2A6FTE1_9MICO|nr:MAG: N-acetyltransferase family protein [Candidatus Lumbricidophila eiseniae]